MALQITHLPVSAIKKLCHLRDPVVVTPTSLRTWRNFDSISFVSGLISNATVGIITLSNHPLRMAGIPNHQVGYTKTRISDAATRSACS